MKSYNVLALLFFIAGNCLFSQISDSIRDSIRGIVDIKKLDEVVVIDSRFPFKKSQSGKPTIKIDSKTIEKFQGLGLSSLLKQFSGIEILGSQTYAGQNKTVSIRGGRNRQVLILIDGIRVSDPSRIDNDFNLNFLDLSQIESIEILKGAASSLYGSSAATGVINIKTKKIEQGFNFSLQSSLGSQNSQATKRGLNLFKNNLSLGGGSDRIRTRAYFAHHNATGMSAVLGDEKDPFNNINYGLSFDYKSKSNFEMKGGFDHYDIQSDYDNSFPLEDADFKLSTQMNRIYLNPNYNYKDGSISLRLGYQKTDRDFQSSYPFQTSSENTQIELFNKYILNKNIYTVVGTLIQNNYADYEGGQQINQADFFGNVVTNITRNFRFNFGGRLNNHSSYGSHFTYSLNPSLQLIEKDKNSLKFISSFSTAFISPSLFQLFDPYSGNPDLEPEENSTFETGFSFKFYDWNLNTTYFNRLETPSLIYDLTSYRYENSISDARYYGAEFILNGNMSKKINLDHQMTFTYTKDGDLRNLPNFSSITRLNFKYSENLNFDLNTQIVGKRFGLDSETILDNYQLVNLSFSYFFKNKSTRLFLHVTNLFNVDYIEIEGYATRGRNIVGGLSYRL